MSDLLNYDPTKHKVTIGPILVNDYADGQMLHFEFPELRTVTEGVTGKCTVNERAGGIAKIEIRVWQNTPIAIVLERLAISGEKFPFMYADISAGGRGWYAGEALFTKVPNKTVEQDASALKFDVVAPHCKPVL